MTATPGTITGTIPEIAPGTTPGSDLQTAPSGPDISTSAAQQAARERAEIDRSCAGPCLAFFVSSAVWLLIGTAFALLASIKMHHPDFLGSFSFLTFGRVRPAHLDVVTFGWASMAALGTLLWLMCRLCRVPLKWPGILVVACGLWNVGVIAGVTGVLLGQSTGIEWLEFPTYAAFMLFAAFAVVAVWGIMTFAARREPHVYVSQWYLFGALFWFPWLYATVQLILIMQPVKGVPQAITNWWFGHNVLGVWFTPIGLATAYYLIPKVIGRPVHSYYLSVLGFWSLALFYNWAGAHHLISGPVPAWIQTVSIVGSVMMFIPVLTVAVNHHMTTRKHFKLLKYSPTLRFVVFGAMSYTVVSVQGSLMSIPTINEPTHFTHYTIAHAHLGLYAFFTMMMFGAMYYIIPRLTGREWASPRLIRVHFWGTAVGVLMMFGVLSLGGIIQGLEWNQATTSLGELVHKDGLFHGTWQFFTGLKQQNGAVPFLTTVRDSVPWLMLRSVSGILIAVGHLAFFVLIALNVLWPGKSRANGPTLLCNDLNEYQRLTGTH